MNTETRIFYGGHWCKVYEEPKDMYGFLSYQRDREGYSGTYFYSFYTKKDHEKYLKNMEKNQPTQPNTE
jgi:hypothetical protein